MLLSLLSLCLMRAVTAVVVSVASVDVASVDVNSVVVDDVFCLVFLW